jgi:hypothetical protein
VGDPADKLNALLPPARNFDLALADRVRAQEGIPAHLRRKREIEDLTALAVACLRDARATGRTAWEVRRLARMIDLDRLNTLIDRHNRYYPIEANLPIDPKTGGSLDGGKRWEPLALVTAESLLTML